MKTSSSAFVIGFPPVGLSTSINPVVYVLIMIIDLVLPTVPAFLFYRFGRPQWVQTTCEQEE